MWKVFMVCRLLPVSLISVCVCVEIRPNLILKLRVWIFIVGVAAAQVFQEFLNPEISVMWSAAPLPVPLASCTRVFLKRSAHNRHNWSQMGPVEALKHQRRRRFHHSHPPPLKNPRHTYPLTGGMSLRVWRCPPAPEYLLKVPQHPEILSLNLLNRTRELLLFHPWQAANVSHQAFSTRVSLPEDRKRKQKSGGNLGDYSSYIFFDFSLI